MVDTPVSLLEVRGELGLSGHCSLLTDVGDASVNDCSGGGDLSAPINLLLWSGYDHDALPASASAFSGNPGNDASPSEDPQQSSWVYMSWSEITCADTYDVMAASGSGGSLTKIATTTLDEFYADYLTLPETSRYYIIRAVAGVGSPSPTTGPDSAELHLKTTPALPKSPSANDGNGNCSGMVIRVSWNNGTSPGIRASRVEHRWRKLPAAFSGTFLGPTTVSALYLDQDVGSGHSDSDQFEFEIRYVDGGGSTVTATSTISCFE